MADSIDPGDLPADIQRMFGDLDAAKPPTGFMPLPFYGVSDTELQGSPSDAEVQQAFQVPAAVFDLELPWTTKNGRVLNKFGVRIGSFENWEQADAIVATMNASHTMLEAMARLNAAAAGVPSAPVPDPEPVDASLQIVDKNMADLIEEAGKKLRRLQAKGSKAAHLRVGELEFFLDPNLDDTAYVKSTNGQIETIRQFKLP